MNRLMAACTTALRAIRLAPGKSTAPRHANKRASAMKPVAVLTTMILAVGLAVTGAGLASAEDNPAPSGTPAVDVVPTTPDTPAAPATDPAPTPESAAVPTAVTPTAVTPAAVTLAAVTPTIVIAAWNMPSWVDSTTPTWPQTLKTSEKTTSTSLNTLDETLRAGVACGTTEQFQVDLYNDDAITTSLIAGKILTQPHTPPESLIPGGWGTAYKLIQVVGAKCPVPPTMQKCDAITDGGVSTNLNANGWTFGETRTAGSNTYVSKGIKVETTASAGGNAQSKAAGYHALSMPLSDMGEPSMAYTDASGVLPSMQIGLD
ncbi:MAG: hypothetical protein ABI400_01605, partial [Lacisediminihabitans sp.]